MLPTATFSAEEENLIRKSAKPLEGVTISLDEGSLKYISWAVSEYFFRLHTEDNAPRPSAIRHDLGELAKHAATLEASFSGLSRHARQETGMALNIQDRLGAVFPEVDLENIEVDLSIIAVAIRQHLSSLPKDQGGRPREYALEVFLVRLGSIFKKATDREPTVTTISTGMTEDYAGDFFYWLELI